MYSLDKNIAYSLVYTFISKTFHDKRVTAGISSYLFFKLKMEGVIPFSSRISKLLSSVSHAREFSEEWDEGMVKFSPFLAQKEFCT